MNVDDLLVLCPGMAREIATVMQRRLDEEIDESQYLQEMDRIFTENREVYREAKKTIEGFKA